MKRSLFVLVSLSIMGLTLFALTGCGGGGSEGSSSVSTPPTSSTPHIMASTTALAFGDVVLDNYLDQTITVQNTGSSSLTIGQIAKANPLALPFSIVTDTCSGKQVTPSGTCTLQVRFSPSNQGEFSDTFDIPSNDPKNNSVSVNVGGQGRALRVSIIQATIGSCPNISLVVAVTDKNGTPAPGLLQTNFSVSENGAPQAISSVSAILSPKPVSTAVLMDSSGSMTDVLPDVETATTSFINQLGPGDQAEIIKFAGTFQVEQGFTSDKSLLNAAIASAFTNTSGTLVYDSLWRAIEDTATQPSTNVRALILVSDGYDNDRNDVFPGSVHTLTQVIDLANQNGVAIFTIGLGNVNTSVMTQLASETGGQYFFAPSFDQLSSIYQGIRNIFNGQYTVEYQSTSAGSKGSSTMLGVVVVDQSGNEGVVSKQITGCP